MLPRRPVVGILGSGERADPAAAEIARWVAGRGWHLLTGAGGGVMAAASQAFTEVSNRRGLVIGIVPGEVKRMEALERREPSAPIPGRYSARQGYPNAWVEIAIFTHLPDSGVAGTLGSSRNHINVLSANALVAFPGGEGTFSEMWLAVQYGVPILAFGLHDEVPNAVERALDLEEVKTFLVRVIGDDQPTKS